MNLSRTCSKTACTEPAVATLTYVYAERAAVLGPLATYAEPHTYDLCAEHATRLTAPRGWDVVRLDGDYRPVVPPDDLAALADAVRESRPTTPADPDHHQPRHAAPPTPEQRRAQLRVLHGDGEG